MKAQIQTMAITGFLAVSLLSSCGLRAPDSAKITEDPLLQEHYSAFTSRHVSKADPIMVQLSDAVISPDEVGTTPGKNPFSFSPRVKGEVKWTDRYTLTFYPTEWLKSGTVYQVTFDGKAIGYGPDNMPQLQFEIETPGQSLEIKDINVNISSADSQADIANIEGSLVTADISDTSKVKEILRAQYNGNTKNIKWAFGKTSHIFSITGLNRSDQDQHFDLQWNGKPIGAKVKGETSITIPSLQHFDVIRTSISPTPSTHLVIHFSQPLDPSQDFSGLINIEDATGINFRVQDNMLRAIPRDALTGNKQVSIEPGIRSQGGMIFNTTYEVVMAFDSPKPALRNAGDGNIIPGSGRMIYPVEAIGLNGVHIDILKIFKNNVHQFLQSNELSGSFQLNRVGRIKYSETFNFKKNDDFDPYSWKRYFIDLTSLIDPEPGALYTVYVSFDKGLSEYACEEENKASATHNVFFDTEDNKPKTLQSLQHYPNGYRWQERDNPCHVSYYNPSRWITNTLLSTDLGITAVSGNEEELYVFVTGLTDAKPKSGVEVTAFDYQNQVVGKGSTNRDGELRLDPGREVFLLEAKHRNDIGYLKINYNSRLNTGNFETGGVLRQKGVKGYIYSERDVRRPGDTIFAGFILEDRYDQVPAGHPIMITLNDPRGNEMHKKVRSRKPDHDHYLFRFNTSTDAPTGNWLITIEAGHAKFSKYFRIETILPNRLDMNLEFVNDELLLWDPRSMATLQAEWLHGATASELDTRVEAIIRQQHPVFEGMEDYRFDNPAGYFGPVRQKVFEGKLDATGKAEFRPGFNIDHAPGLLGARFEVRVFEPGGGFSTQSFTAPLHPFKHYAGIKTPRPDGNRRYLQTGQDLSFDLALVNHQGNPVNNGNLNITVYEMNWRWWWNRSQENLRQYTQGGNAESKHTEQVVIHNGKGNFRYTIPEGQHGRYFIRACDPESGHCTGEIVYIGRPSLSHIGRTAQAEGLQWIGLVTDKEEYKTGEEVNVNIPVETPSNALILLKHGNKIISREWKNSPDGKDITYSFKAEPGMTPNLYVHVSIFQPHEYTYNNVPARMYGIVPVNIYDPGTKLTPVLDIPEQIRPQTTNTLSVSEQNNKPMHYSVAIVDEGLLNLTGFLTPDPWNSFFAKEALSITTWDMYDLVMSSPGSDLRGLLRPGGGVEMKDIDAPDVAERFRPVVKVMGPFELQKGQQRKHTFELPQYIGRVRAMVIASTSNAYGSTHKSVKVRSPLMVTATLPRLIRPDESFRLPVHVWAYDHAAGNIDLNLETNRFFKVIGSPRQTVNLQNEGRQTVYYQVTAIKEEGMGNIILTASGGGESERFTSELSVQNLDIPLKKYETRVLEPGSSWKGNAQAFGIPGTNEGWLEVSSVKPLNLSTRLEYLMRYPHGCLEQTISGVFPQLYLDKLLDLPQDKLNEIERNTREAISRISQFQTASGGLSLWPGIGQPCEWTSIYTAHFLIEAKKQGYDIPNHLLSPLISYLRNAVNNLYLGNSGNQFAGAYMLYVLALTGEPEWGAMNRLRSRPDINNDVRWRLAAAYFLAGRQDAAKELVQDANIRESASSDHRQSFGSQTRNMAMILETLSLLGERNQGLELYETISDRLSNQNYWMSTQTTAYSLIAIAAFHSEFLQKPVNATIFVNEDEFVFDEQKSIIQKELDFEATGNIDLSVENTGESLVYVQLITRGVPLPEDNFPQAAQNNLQVNVNYINSNGKIISPGEARRGEDLVVEVSVRYTGYEHVINNIALSNVFPPGWEIHGLRLHDDQRSHESSFDYRDIRDDRVYTYFSLTNNETKIFQIPVNVAYAGRFYLPGVHIEAMYNGNVNAVRPGQWVEIVDP